MPADLGSIASVRRPGPPPPGLCGACRHSRRIETRSGSVFRLCERAAGDPGYPRYPALPMIRCRGFEPLRDEGSSYPF